GATGGSRAAAGSARLLRAQAIAANLGLDVADQVALQLDPHLVPLNVPVLHRGEPAEDAVRLGNEPAPAIDQGGAAGELVLALHLGAAEAQDLLAGRLAGYDPLEHLPGQDDPLGSLAPTDAPTPQPA